MLVLTDQIVSSGIGDFGLRFCSANIRGYNPMESEDDAVLSFLQSIDSSDDECSTLNGKSHFTNSKSYESLSRTKDAAIFTTKGLVDVPHVAGDRRISEKPAPMMNSTYQRNILALPRDGMMMALRGVGKVNNTTKEAESNKQIGVDENGSDDIDLASIRAVAKAEAPGEALLTCLDPVVLPPSTRSRTAGPAAH